MDILNNLKNVKQKIDFFFLKIDVNFELGTIIGRMISQHQHQILMCFPAVTLRL